MPENSVLEIVAYGAWNGGDLADNSIYEQKKLHFKGGIPVNNKTILIANKLITNVHERGNCSVVCMQRLPYDLKRGALQAHTRQGFKINGNLDRPFFWPAAGLTPETFSLSQHVVRLGHQGPNAVSPKLSLRIELACRRNAK